MHASRVFCAGETALHRASVCLQMCAAHLEVSSAAMSRASVCLQMSAAHLAPPATWQAGGGP